ncbi:FG-GAP-like repeat-containing protein [Nocardioides speluncae]|uniref:FG-GAP-like repeat-containing protein n=1 Tax=Nocardioides speluncae TaxID=2670337 RepID=UPI000D698661|nr:FG-GAP-like repeat-containing protein [Nocardioides speluncae]
MSTHPRKARHLLAISISVAATAALAVTVTPPGAANEGGAIVLTDQQAEDLAERVRVDPYGDSTAVPHNPQQAPDAAGSGEEPDAADPTNPTSAETASGSWRITPRSSLEAVQGMAATVPIGGAGEDYLMVHALGSVQRRTAAGDTVWRRDNESLYADWQVTPVRPWQAEPAPARILMGFNAVSPFTAASDDGFTTGDLTGDGVDDVVFTASVGVRSYRPFTSPGSSLPNGTFVTVLDGASGATLWHKLYAAAYNVELVDGTLVVADSPYYNLNAPSGARATLTGLRFAQTGGRLTSTEVWSHDTGAFEGASWASVTPVGDGLVAASWNQRKLSPSAAPSGHTLLLDASDGTVRWTGTDRLYSRQLRVDAERDRLVALEQSDVREEVRYEIATYSLADGERRVLDRRVNALPLALEVADLQHGSAPEYAVSESTLDENLYINANTVRALDGSDGTSLWSRTVKRDPSHSRDGGGAWGLQVVDDKLVASYLDDRGTGAAGNRGGDKFARLVTLSGSTGAVRWEQRGVVGSPMFAQPFRRQDGWRLRTVDANQNVHTYNLGSGKALDLLPLQGSLSSAVASDVDGDGADDLVVAGESRGVFAYAGRSLKSGSARRLWTSVVPGPVHAIVEADTDGDGADEIVVAADSATVVLDRRTGKVLTTIDAAGRFARSVTAADLDGDGAAEIVVPTDAVRAYDGRGTPLWEYAAPPAAGDVVFSDVSVSHGRVHAQYTSRDALSREEVAAGAVALKGADGSPLWSHTPEPGPGTDGEVHAAPLHAGTFAAPGIPYADGHAVVHTWFTRDAERGLLVTVVQIRDGRTGELQHEALAGGPWTLGNWFTGPEGLVMAGTASLRTFAANGVDHRMFTLSPIQTAAYATGPDRSRILVGGASGAVISYSPAVLTAGVNYPPSVASLPGMAAREILVADFDADGIDEVVSMDFDDEGADRTAALVGGGYWSPADGIRRLVTATLDAG